eukprot:scaffold26100_cov31-Attheya_sp.AAC.3
MFDTVTGCCEEFEDKAKENRKEADNPLIDDPRNTDLKVPEIHSHGARSNGVSMSRSKKKTTSARKCCHKQPGLELLKLIKIKLLTSGAKKNGSMLFKNLPEGFFS